MSGEAFESSVDSVRFTALAHRVVCGRSFAASVPLIFLISKTEIVEIISGCSEFQGFSHLSDAIRAIDRSSSPRDL